MPIAAVYHRCSCLTHQHGGEQSGLVTLTFDLESGVRVTCDMGYICANFGLQTDRRNVYVRLCIVRVCPSHAAVVFKRLNLS